MLETTTEKAIFKLVGRRVKSSAPKVSVVIPAYNIADYIQETLDSVLTQTFKDYEIIVINDGSPDTEKFEKVLEKYLDEIIYLKHENVGVGPARNVAIGHSRGELLAFLDGDDVWLNDYLEEQIGFLEANNFDLVYTDAYLFGGSMLDGKTFMQTAASEGEANFESLLDMRCNVILSGSIAIKKTVLDAGNFEPKNVRAQDFHLWLRMAHSGARVGYQTKPLLKYRVRLDSLSGDSVQRVQREIDVYHRIMDAIELKESELEIVRKHLDRLEAEMEIERGKSFLLKGEFVSASESFEKANEYRHSSRLQMIIWLARFAPRLLLKIYRSRRADEIGFVPGGVR
jgi:glycosyltransferase involved in cell wall biosynthesis